MSSIGLNRRINKFLDVKQREVFGSRDMDVDAMIADLAKEGRSNSVF